MGCTNGKAHRSPHKVLPMPRASWIGKIASTVFRSSTGGPHRLLRRHRPRRAVVLAVRRVVAVARFYSDPAVDSPPVSDPPPL